MASFDSVHLDPNFAVICAFFEKFSTILNMDIPNFELLEEWLTNSDEINSSLKDLHIKLLRKTRRTVHETAWETALIKFCHTYNSQDAWELERFGYKNSCTKVKLRILKELLENQFERNGKFRSELLQLKADSLRSDPIGRDQHGYSYWFTQDKDCNFRVYQEHLDENSWQIVARNREEFVNLIERLKSNELITSIEIGIIDEDSSSISCVDTKSSPPEVYNSEGIEKDNSTNMNIEEDENTLKLSTLSKITIENSTSKSDVSKLPNIKLKFSNLSGQGYVENVNEKKTCLKISEVTKIIEDKENGEENKNEINNEIIEFSEVIEEEKMIVTGEGNGVECDMGNSNDDSHEIISKKKRSLIEVKSTYFVENSDLDKEKPNIEKNDESVKCQEQSETCRKRRLSKKDTDLSKTAANESSDVNESNDEHQDIKSNSSDNMKNECKKQKLRSKVINVNARRKVETTRILNESSSEEETRQLMKTEVTDEISNSKENILNDNMEKEIKKQNEPKPPSLKKGKVSRKEIDTKNIIDTSETPVRQSRRIAQQKIKEEAERRKLEEVALKKMKSDFKRNKKVSDGKLTSSCSHSEQDDDSDDDNFKGKVIKKKNGIDKKRKKQGWSSGSEEQDEEEDEPEQYYDSDKRSVLKSDHEFSPESDIEDTSQLVPLKRARTVCNEGDTTKVFDFVNNESCMRCGKTDHPEWILLCDKCDKGYHCSCLSPVLFYIPEGDWFCPPCQQENLISSLQKRLEEFDNLVHQKEKEEELRLEKEKSKLEEDLKIAAISNSKKNHKRRIENDSSGKDSNEEDDSSSSSADCSIDSSSKTKNHVKDLNRESSTGSSSYSDDEPIYKLRKRRQINVSYRLNEYDNLIKSALKEEITEEDTAGNLGRGKDINTIIKAVDKAEKEQNSNDEKNGLNEDSKSVETKKIVKVRSDSRKKHLKKRTRKLNSLDDNSQSDDDSDEDFRTSSIDEDEEESFTAGSESSLELSLRRKKSYKKSQRYAARQRKKDKEFIVDDSDESEPLKSIWRKGKRKKILEDSEDSENEESEENSEDIDSEELCDDSTESDDKKTWKPNSKRKYACKTPAINKPVKKKVTNLENCDKGNKLKTTKNISKENLSDGSSDSLRKTRGRRFTYLEDFDDDSSDGGIKPGVQRPDTPPEERAMFIKKQEEIKRMLAEKNTNASKIAPVPRISPIGDIDKASAGSLSTVPLSVIRQAKVLDVDFLQKKSDPSNEEDVLSDEFDDGLPEDFYPDDMDEEAIAKMMEEEDFATHQLKLAGDIIRQKKPLNSGNILKSNVNVNEDLPDINEGKFKESNDLNTNKRDDQVKVVPTEILKPRVRRKKITPLRDAIQKQQTAAAILNQSQSQDNSLSSQNSKIECINIINPNNQDQLNSAINATAIRNQAHISSIPLLQSSSQIRHYSQNSIRFHHQYIKPSGTVFENSSILQSNFPSTGPKFQGEGFEYFPSVHPVPSSVIIRPQKNVSLLPVIPKDFTGEKVYSEKQEHAPTNFSPFPVGSSSDNIIETETINSEVPNPNVTSEFSGLVSYFSSQHDLYDA